MVNLYFPLLYQHIKRKPCQLKSPTVELTECYCIRIQSCDALSNQKCQHYASMAIGHV